MLRQIHFLSFLMLATFMLSFTACDRSGTANTSKDNGAESNPSAPSEHGEGLPKVDRASLDAWIKMPLKSCDPSAILRAGVESVSTPKGIDIEILAERTGRRLWIPDSMNRDVVVALNGAVPFDSSYARVSKVDINGKTDLITNDGEGPSKATLQVENNQYECIIKIDGVQVAKRSIAKAIGYSVMAPDRDVFDPVSVFPDRSVRNDGSMSIDLQLVTEKLFAVLRSGRSGEVIFRQIGYSAGESEEYFKLSERKDADGLAFETTPENYTFAKNELVVNADESFRWPRSGETKNFTLSTVYNNQTRGRWGGVLFDADLNKMALVKHRVSVTAQSKERGEISYQFKDLGMIGWTAVLADQDQVARCVLKRAEYYSPTALEYRAIDRFHPLTGIGELVKECEVLEPRLADRLPGSGLELSILQVMLRNIDAQGIRENHNPLMFDLFWQSFRDQIVMGLRSGSVYRLALGDNESTVLKDIDATIQDVRKMPELAQVPTALLPSIAKIIEYIHLRSYLDDDFQWVNGEKWLKRAIVGATKLDETYVTAFQTLLLFPESNEDRMRFLERSPPSLFKLGALVFQLAQKKSDSESLLKHYDFFDVQPSEESLKRRLQYLNSRPSPR